MLKINRKYFQLQSEIQLGIVNVDESQTKKEDLIDKKELDHVEVLENKDSDDRVQYETVVMDNEEVLIDREEGNDSKVLAIKDDDEDYSQDQYEEEDPEPEMKEHDLKNEFKDNVEENHEIISKPDDNIEEDDDDDISEDNDGVIIEPDNDDDDDDDQVQFGVI